MEQVVVTRIVQILTLKIQQVKCVKNALPTALHVITNQQTVQSVLVAYIF